MLESLVAVPFDISKTIEKEELNKNTVRDSLTLLSLMSGIPILPAAKPIGYLMDVENGNAQPTGPIDYTRGLVTGRSGK